MINPYVAPGLPPKKIFEDPIIRTKGLRILSVVCSYFETDYKSILTAKSKLPKNVNTKKYYYYFLNKILNLNYHFIVKHKLSYETKRNVKYHIDDVEDKLSVKDSNTIKIINEIKNYLE